MTKKVTRVIYEKFVSGDPLTNEEVKIGVTFFDDLSQNLASLGPVFHLAHREALRVYFALNGFKKAREEKYK